MKPESLKQLAEYMGYEAAYSYQHPNEIIIKKSDWEDFDPLTNAEQCLELMEKFKVDLIQYKKGIQARIYTKTPHPFSSIERTGKTINEAVTNAAIAAIKEK